MSLWSMTRAVRLRRDTTGDGMRGPEAAERWEETPP